MALPLIAAGVAARAVAKKLASRATGGITGAGAKQVNKVYKNMGATKSEVKANARGLKAANKPVTKNKEEVYALDKKWRDNGFLKPGQTTEYTRNQLKNVIKPARPNRTRGGNLRGE
jgi:hypothetical protein